MEKQEKIELFSTSSCQKCEQLGTFLEKHDVTYIKRVIDVDPDAETDALMLGIYAAPALRKGKELMTMKEMFKDGVLIEDNVTKFLSLADQLADQGKSPKESPRVQRSKNLDLLSFTK